MRELAVYYCQKCGYYAYYQLSKNAVCPKCGVKMEPLKMRYQDFMNLDLEERDHLLARVILSSYSPIVTRVIAQNKCSNNREIIASLAARLQELEEENKKLNNTVSWMHQTIWDLLRKNRESEKLYYHSG